MKRKTVFVIGAGASAEVDLPTGETLKSKISNMLNLRFDFHKQKTGDEVIVEALRLYVKNNQPSNQDTSPLIHEARHISDSISHALSIDNFIDQHRDNEKIALCGKLAIIKSILDAEKSSSLFFDPYKNKNTINFKSIEKTWYIDFFKFITENCSKDELKERFQSITLIIFNYDRCVEHFLFHILQNFYKFSEIEATELIKHLNIYHPYGHVGFLPWWQQNESMAYGQTPTAQQLLSLVQQIKTFSEGTHPDSSDIQEIKDHMAKASHVIFLGFAFHKLNMQLIHPSQTTEISNVVRCYTTTYETSEHNKEAIKEQVTSLYASRHEVSVKMINKTCSGFFNEFWRSLAF